MLFIQWLLQWIPFLGWGKKHVSNIFFFYIYIPNPSSHTIALGLTQPVTEMSIRNLPEGKGWPARKADNLTAIGEPIV
jgi:hypothetical protein